MVKKFYPDRFVFIFYFAYTLCTLFLIINIVTGVLYFNYTAVVNKVIEDNLEDKEFCVIMKLCLKDGIVKSERVQDIIEKYRQDPAHIEFLAMLHKAKKGKLELLLKYTHLDQTDVGGKPFTERWYYRAPVSISDGFAVVFMLLMMENYTFTESSSLTLQIIFAGVSMADWIIRI